MVEYVLMHMFTWKDCYKLKRVDVETFGTSPSNTWYLKMQNNYQEYVKLKARVEVLQHSQRYDIYITT
jgi:hypothetical protein